ncbi:hypothetical protein AB0P21_01520 [Kribbella sp. NPDC056861]|uniref:alpha/beta fold hydrolase n=1 Tax=Kribbella sp. NPDC056861 TaxID=3154857 RepID=UPI00342A9B1B
MTETLGYGKYAAGGCDIGGLVTSQLGHKYADALYGIHIGLLAWLLERWNAWSDGPLETVFTKDDLLTHATIYWANRYPWTPSHNRTPVVEAPVGLTFVSYENPPGIHTTDDRVEAFKSGPQSAWFNHVNVTAHTTGGHFIPWENPDAWVNDLRRTFHTRRP